MTTLHLHRLMPFGKFALLGLAAALLVGGCAGHGQRPLAEPAPLPWTKTELVPVQVHLLLEEHLAAWQGVPYRHGGLSRQGIDCSGFVHLTFREKFGVALPRTTEKLAEVGIPLSRAEVASGDLVFFTMGRTGRHVGIALDDNRFIHASSSRGVIQSSLASPYWSGRFRQGRRVLAFPSPGDRRS
jgi:probable lipoprotein NlpC